MNNLLITLQFPNDRQQSHLSKSDICQRLMKETPDHLYVVLHDKNEGSPSD